MSGVPAPDGVHASKASSGLNDNQVGAVMLRLASLDKLFGHLDELARGPGSPFTAERADFTPDEAALLQAFVSRARAALVAALDALGIERPVAAGSARWSATTALTFADITAGELNASFLRGYGEVQPDAARAVEAVARRLRTIVQDGKALLHEHDPGGLADRLARLAGPVGEVLRLIDEVSTIYRLAAIRPLIAAAADRAEDTLFAVGVFGRVSAGKSSLIDALLGADVLPVGATPVTAVPVSIERGSEAVVVDFVAGTQGSITVAELPAYVTEQGNPDNRRGVRSVRVQIPTAPAGVRLLDTPGVGSLAGGGPARTFAWLPRCDFGLILIAAGTPVGRDELALVSGLVNAGIACHVLLSKADTLSDADRRAAVQYVGEDLRRALGSGVVPPVMAVSVRPDERTTLDSLRHDVLEPLASDHVEQTSEALVRRLRSLIVATARATHTQNAALRVAPDDGAGEPAVAFIALSDGTGGEEALRSIRETTEELANAAPRIADETVNRVVSAWEHGEDARDVVRATIVSAVGAAIAQVRDAMPTQSGSRNESAGNPAADTAEERMPPLFDAELLDGLPPLEPPRLALAPLRWRAAARQLAQLRPQLDTALSRYAARLAAWGEARVERRVERSGYLEAADAARTDPRAGTLPELAEALHLVNAIESAPAPVPARNT